MIMVQAKNDLVCNKNSGFRLLAEIKSKNDSLQVVIFDKIHNKDGEIVVTTQFLACMRS